MVLWDDAKGGKYPWDPRYGQTNPNTTDGFDPLYAVQHATDSSATATALATGQKVRRKYRKTQRIHKSSMVERETSSHQPKQLLDGK